MNAATRLAGSAREAVTAHDIARHALRALHAELVLSPKPGLVSPADRGSHDDMDATTFIRSLFSLRSYFRDIAQAGAMHAHFPALRALGIEAETRMLRATGGINTHRGAIFSLGLLAAAAGLASRRGDAPGGDTLGCIVRTQWAPALAVREAGSPPSHGEVVARRHGVSGARGEAMRGFPSVFECALPALRKALARGAAPDEARVQALFALLARVDDTNVLHRGGFSGAQFLRDGAREFLARGGVFADRWHDRAAALHSMCVARRLSPGGCADLLAATLFVHGLSSAA